MRKFLKVVLFIAIALAIGGCSPLVHKYSPSADSDSYKERSPKKIAIFFDGTANDANSDTNVKQLHSLVTLQKDNNISTAYIVGVGTGFRTVGKAVGFGIGADAREAYKFLLKHYSKGDEIYIFGFSRGAYAARILSSLLYSAGLPDIKNKNIDDKNTFAYLIYNTFKGDKSRDTRNKQLRILYAAYDIPDPEPVDVKVLGLWDTVEALGIPNFNDDVDVPNYRYGDQLCNVKDAYQAISADDDRARIFTPILLTRKHLYDDCEGWSQQDKEEHQKNHVHEVLFAGAHADVGGGYDNEYLSGVSLNWMISNLSGTNLLPEGAGVPQNKYGNSHNPATGVWGVIYHKMPRNFVKYVNMDESFSQKLKVHQSVFDRLESISHETYEFDWKNQFKECFEPSEKGIKLVKDQNCFEVIENK